MLCQEQQQSFGCTSWVLGDGADELWYILDRAEFLSDVGVQHNYEVEQAKTVSSV